QVRQILGSLNVDDCPLGVPPEVVVGGQTLAVAVVERELEFANGQVVVAIAQGAEEGVATQGGDESCESAAEVEAGGGVAVTGECGGVRAGGRGRGGRPGRRGAGLVDERFERGDLGRGELRRRGRWVCVARRRSDGDRR